jgi:hypothetical protein
MAKNTNLNLFGKQKDVSQVITTTTETSVDVSTVQEFCQTAGGMISGGIVAGDDRHALEHILAQIEGSLKAKPVNKSALRSALEKFIESASGVAAKTAGAALSAAASSALSSLG